MGNDDTTRLSPGEVEGRFVLLAAEGREYAVFRVGLGTAASRAFVSSSGSKSSLTPRAALAQPPVGEGLGFRRSSLRAV